MKEVKIRKGLEKAIVELCDGDLNYKINESGCATEYKRDVETEIELLRLLGYEELADAYSVQYEKHKVTE